MITQLFTVLLIPWVQSKIIARDTNLKYGAKKETFLPRYTYILVEFYMTTQLGPLDF